MTVETSELPRHGQPTDATPQQQLLVVNGGRVVTVPPDESSTHPRSAVDLHSATIVVYPDRITASEGDLLWTWVLADVVSVVHGANEPWTLFAVDDLAGFGVAVPDGRRDEFRQLLATLAPSLVPTFVEVASPPGAITEEIATIATGPSTDSSAHAPTGIEAKEISAWFGTRLVLDRVSLDMAAGHVTALIGPSGCGKSTFLRVLNRMHEMIPGARMAGEVIVGDGDIYDSNRRTTEARRQVGMVFQKPNPFPAMSIYDNVLASLRLTGTKASQREKDDIVERCLRRAGLWNEVRDRLRQPGGGLSGGQQQRLCIARALAIRPLVLLMDEPCSALDPTSTRRIEETIGELSEELTIVIVTHNMQQAARVSQHCAFFLAEHGTPGVIVEHGPTTAMFGNPQDQRTSDYVNGRFG